MSGKSCDIRIGTSGWYYDHWKGRFYPEKLPKSKWFGYYAQHFDTVEVNNTFYHLPKEQTLKNWHSQVPENFLYSVKANRYITHIKRLKDASDALERFFDAVGLLKENLGPVLYQLPPSLHKDLDLLESFIKLLGKRPSACFEFRHKSWYEDDTFELLEKHDAAFCIHDLAGCETPRIITAQSIYVRFHGTTGRYSGAYTDKMLAGWAEWIQQNAKFVKAVYAYFNNDVSGYAVKNAETLLQLLSMS